MEEKKFRGNKYNPVGLDLEERTEVSELTSFDRLDEEDTPSLKLDD